MGPKVWDIKGFKGGEVDTHMKRVAICQDILTTVDPIAGRKPDAMFIDAGAGQSLRDTLVSFGFDNVQTVPFGQSPLKPEVYPTKRDEMYGLCGEAMSDEFSPFDMPDDDELQADLCTTIYTIDHQSRRKLASKEKILKEFGMSPDLADALVLTFAYPVDINRTANLYFAKPIKPKLRTSRSRRGAGGLR